MAGGRKRNRRCILSACTAWELPRGVPCGLAENSAEDQRSSSGHPRISLKLVLLCHSHTDGLHSINSIHWATVGIKLICGQLTGDLNRGTVPERTSLFR